MTASASDFDRFSPVGWDEVDRLLRQSAKTLGRRLPRRSGPTRKLDGFVLALTVPHWANELSGGKVPAKTLRELQRLQAHLLTFFLVYDPVLDEDARAQANPGEMLPLLSELHCGLSAFFGPRDPFWPAYRKLVQQQLASSRWEREGRDLRTPPFDAKLIRSLGLKLSLLRWPAFAVAGLSGRRELARPLDRLFDRFYRVLQLLDDATDVETDRAKGQINGVVAAMAELPRRVPRELATAIGIARVCAAALAELGRIQRALPPQKGRFGLACEALEESCRQSQRGASALAGQLLAKDMCDRVVSALA